jgi:hypothetical protein
LRLLRVEELRVEIVEESWVEKLRVEIVEG